MKSLGEIARSTGRFPRVGALAYFIAALIVVVTLSPLELRADHAHEHETGGAQLHDASPLTQARSLQREHRFSESALVLASFLEENPLHAEAQLLHADVLRHDGRINDSRHACFRVALAGATTLAGYCGIQILLDEGNFNSADSASQRLAPLRTQLNASAHIWALEISAEAAWRAGRIDAARKMYLEAIKFEDVPHSTVDAFAEFLEATKLVSP